MAGQEQIKRNRQGGGPGDADLPDPAPVAAPVAQTHDIDDLLDEIDGVLETNAEEFVRGFVQKGGQ
jgi:ubiquitin-like protein Pup